MLPVSPDAPWLAPLAGWSDLPFRLLCREQGAAACCTEMVSAKGLVYGGKNTEDLLQTADGDQPLVVQVFGAEPEFMQKAVRILKDRGFAWFDVNMGCSVPKVTKTGAGAALLRDVPGALRVAKAVIGEAGAGHCGFKLRLGWDAGSEVFLELSRGLERLGAGWVTLHPRHAKEGFSGVPRLSAIAETVRALSIPVIASGDLFTAEDGIRVLRATGCAAVMYARGALRDPGIFAWHRALLCGRTADDEGSGSERAGLVRLMRRHICLARRYAPQSAFLKMRTFLPRYAKGSEGAKMLRREIIACGGWDSMEAVIDRFESGGFSYGEEDA
ncbi:MAG: tRNA-dihydrouridine synthase family protein [Mailhella sp.]|nr:tRNA-dihydrouridine synthase family protein [Mailhella sp.]